MQQASVKDGNARYTFSRDKEIIPYIDQYWDAITAMPRRVTQSWYTTVQKTLAKDVQTLFTFEETENGPMFGLVSKELTSIRPEVVVNGKNPLKTATVVNGPANYYYYIHSFVRYTHKCHEWGTVTYHTQCCSVCCFPH